MFDITFRHLESSDTIRSLAAEQLARIQKNHGEALRCHLVLADQRGPHAHHDQHFAAHVTISVGDLSCQADSAHEDATVAVREAFEKLDRQLTRDQDRRSEKQRAHAARNR
jgi:ribosomal subunit interface protein